MDAPASPAAGPRAHTFRAPAARWRRLARVAAYGLGLALFAAAVVAVARHDVALDRLRHAAADAPASLLIALPLLHLASWGVTTALFLVLSVRFAPVPSRDMAALIGSAWLLNYLPMRPGMMGRAAYHKLVHGIPLRATLRVLLEAMAATALAAITLALAVRAGSVPALPIAETSAALAPTPTAPLELAPWGWALALAPPLLALAAAMIVRRAAPQRVLWRYAAAFALRYADMALWAARYWIVFQLAGEPVSPARAALITAAAQVAMIVPIALGLREWVVAFTAASAPVGLVADLLHRASELLVATPVGLLCGLWLWRRDRARRANASRANPAAPAPPLSCARNGTTPPDV